jgi:hypothetical protein
MRSNLSAKHGWIGGAILVAIILVLVGSCTYIRDIKTGTVTFTVNWLDDQANGRGHKYLVFTSAGVYQDTDNLFHGKFDSSDLFARLRTGQRYTCTYTGFRVPLFSSYRNLIDCRAVR